MHMCSYMWSWHLRLDETHKTRSVVNDVVQSFGHENHVSGFQIVRPFLAQNSAPFAATDSQFPFISSFYVYLTLERFRAFVAFVWETRPSWET